MSTFTTILETTDDVIDTLIRLDLELVDISVGITNFQPVRFVIFGATALLLHTGFRGTSDIDVYMKNRDIHSDITSICNKYSVNNNMQRVMEFPLAEDFWDRSKLIYESEVMHVHLASKEDLVLSKLFAGRGKNTDEVDLIESSILDDCKMDYIQQMYDEYDSLRIGSGVNFTRLDDIIQKREEFKQRQES
ncbi:TPA: hypothetical protein QCX17_002247 [Bacillus cereus]|nr:hypothetical protein [Bacillus cereus]